MTKMTKKTDLLYHLNVFCQQEFYNGKHQCQLLESHLLQFVLKNKFYHKKRQIMC